MLTMYIQDKNISKYKWIIMEVHRMLQAFCDHIVTFHPNMFWVFLGYEVKFFCIQSAEGVGKHVPSGFVVVDNIKTGTEKN